MEQEQVSAKRSSLSVGKLRMVKEGIASEGLPSEQMLGTASFLLEPGEHQRIARKMSDFRGNETFQMMPCT